MRLDAHLYICHEVWQVYLKFFSTYLKNARDLSVYAPSQWETALRCDAVSHWLGTYTEWSLKANNASRLNFSNSQSCHAISNHCQLHCLFSSLFKTITSKFCIAGHLWGESTREYCIPFTKASNVESIFMLWHYHVQLSLVSINTI